MDDTVCQFQPHKCRQIYPIQMLQSQRIQVTLGDYGSLQSAAIPAKLS